MLTELLRIKRTIRNLNRARQIINVFIKHGFGQIIEQLNLDRLLPFRKRIKVITSPPFAEKGIAEHLRMAFAELGPSFIKLAQILSSRPDLITKTFSDEFKKLQDEVPPFPFVEVREIVTAELKRPPEEIFTSFSAAPVAAASIAQVHEATLKDGRSVMVKIQRPRIREIIETDIDIMHFIATLMDKYLPETAFFNPIGIVEEFRRTIRREIDFLEEAKNISRFRRNFAAYPDVFIPAVFPELTTGKIIVMEKVEGVRIDNIEGINKLGLDRTEIARKGIQAYFKMIFDDGFFHGDRHPGNIFVMPDGTIGLVDFG
ncbi:MAG: ABC1 kinase family protein, partial [bacterium]